MLPRFLLHTQFYFTSKPQAQVKAVSMVPAVFLDRLSPLLANVSYWNGKRLPVVEEQVGGTCSVHEPKSKHDLQVCPAFHHLFNYGNLVAPTIPKLPTQLPNSSDELSPEADGVVVSANLHSMLRRQNGPQSCALFGGQQGSLQCRALSPVPWRGQWCGWWCPLLSGGKPTL